MISATWLATWDDAPVLCAKLNVAIDLDEGAIEGITVKSWQRDGIEVPGGVIDWAVVEPFLESLVGLSWEDTDCLEKFDGDEMAWEVINVEEAGRLAHLIRREAESVREERKNATQGPNSGGSK